MNETIQQQAMAIHKVFGTTEMANYKIQLMCEAYANKQVIRELEYIVDDCIHIIREPMLQELLGRIKELNNQNR